MVVNNGAVLPTGLFIGGSWQHSTSAGEMEHVNPATGRVQASFPIAGRAEVDAAVGSAKEARREFRRWSPVRRRELLLSIAALFRRHADGFETIAALECGMVKSAASRMGDSAAAWFDYYAGWPDKLVGEVLPDSSSFDYVRWEPYGVVAIILTWNGPIGSIGMKVAAALAAGCTIVLKAPELAPFGANLFGRICTEAGVPPGVVNVITGGPKAGDALVRHPDIDKISFTGGPATARRIQAAAAETLTPLVLELGGKSATIVFDDADLGRASTMAALAITRLAGQVCHAATRLLVHETVYDRVVETVGTVLDKVAVGDPLDPASEMGPVISSSAVERIMGTIHDAEKNGGVRLVAGGNRLGGALSGGFFVRPTAFADVDNSSALAQEEIFGPVLSLIRFRDEDEAVTLANNSKYGLAANIFTTDIRRAYRVADALDVGNVGVNGGATNAGPFGPFGGFRQSGYGKEGGLLGVREYLRAKNVNVSLD